LAQNQLVTNLTGFCGGVEVNHTSIHADFQALCSHPTGLATDSDGITLAFAIARQTHPADL
jgi:hypothetical protein